MKLDFEIPAKLDTPAFREAWAEWEGHRQESGKKMTARSARMAVKRLSVWGVERAIAAIEYSIAQGYRGIFEDPSASRGGKVAGEKEKKMSLWEIQEREKAIRNELDSISREKFGHDADRINAENAKTRAKLRAKLRELKAAKLDL